MRRTAKSRGPTLGRRRFIKNVGAGLTAICAGNALLSEFGCSSGSTGMMTRDQMKSALKDRISQDDPKNFNANVNSWDQVRLGIYYDEDKELIDIVVYETTSNAVAADGKYLPGPVWRNLIAQVGPANTPDQAVDPMMDAALGARRRQSNDEGADDRPPQKPTLRAARKGANG